MFGVLTWIRIGLFVVVMAAVWYAWHSFWTRHDDAVRAPLIAQLAAAQKRATDISLLWSAQVDKTEASERQRQEAQRVASKALQDRAAALSKVPTVPVSAPGVGVWVDTTRDANGGASVPPEPQPGAVTLSESALLGWVTEAGAAYKDAVGLFHECRAALHGFVNALATPEAQP